MTNACELLINSVTVDKPKMLIRLEPKGAPFRTAKAAVKVRRTLMDLRGSIPSFIHISDGKLHDVNVLDLLIPETGAFYVMDRAYLDFERLYILH